MRGFKVLARINEKSSYKYKVDKSQFLDRPFSEKGLKAYILWIKVRVLVTIDYQLLLMM